jgi:cellulose synthase/poly-beta-1,6-N-acetylglucosamine synthase-like glycosyltransferase
MLSVYLVPVILRPLDFIYNLFSYVSGFLSYFFMMPIFLNVMQVYSMSNLHDISWGNRPTNAH